jgi:hypothetical protein
MHFTALGSRSHFKRLTPPLQADIMKQASCGSGDVIKKGLLIGFPKSRGPRVLLSFIPCVNIGVILHKRYAVYFHRKLDKARVTQRITLKQSFCFSALFTISMAYKEERLVV